MHKTQIARLVRGEAMRPKHYDRTQKERRTSTRNWHNSKKKYRYRQRNNLFWYYAYNRFMTRFCGRWVTDEEMINR